MKKYIKAAEVDTTDSNAAHNEMTNNSVSDTDSIVDVSDEYEMLMSDPVQRKIFANIYILEPDALEAYIRGVLDLADISHISLPGVERLEVAVAIHGAEAVMEAFHSMFGKQKRGN